MVTRIKNEFHYAQPMGRAFATIADAIMSGPSRWEREAMEARTGLYGAQRDYYDAQASQLRSQMEAPQTLAEALRTIYTPGGVSADLTMPDDGQNPYSVDPANRVYAAMPDIAQALARAGRISDMGSVLRAVIANAPEVSDAMVSRAMLGAGDSYGSTPVGALALEQAKPVRVGAGELAFGAPGDPRFTGDAPLRGVDTLATAQGAAFQTLDPDQQRMAVGPALDRVRGTFLSENFNSLDELNTFQRQALGAQPSSSSATPRNYMLPDGRRGITLDGVSDAATGEPIPQGATVFSGQIQSQDASGLTTPVKTELQRRGLAHQRLRSLLDTTRELSQDPLNFGIPGFVKGALQDAYAMVSGVSAALGYRDAEEARREVARTAVSAGINPELLPGVFDPNLPALHTAADLLVFSAAAALAEQKGRDVSDNDVRYFRRIVGDPRNWMTTQERFLAKLDLLERIAEDYNQAEAQFMGGTAVPEAAPSAVDDNDPLGIR